MGRTITVKRLSSALLLLVFAVTAVTAKPLSDKDKAKLAEKVQTQYSETQMDGASAYRFKRKNILVSVVEVKKSANMQKIAQVKASRIAGEYLQGAVNKAVTVYEVSEETSYSLEDKSEEHGTTLNSTTASEINQNVNDKRLTSTQEKFTDKIIQSSITKVGHMEPLGRVADKKNEVVFSYFMILE